MTVDDDDWLLKQSLRVACVVLFARALCNVWFVRRVLCGRSVVSVFEATSSDCFMVASLKFWFKKKEIW